MGRKAHKALEWFFDVGVHFVPVEPILILCVCLSVISVGGKVRYDLKAHEYLGNLLKIQQIDERYK